MGRVHRGRSEHRERHPARHGKWAALRHLACRGRPVRRSAAGGRGRGQLSLRLLPRAPNRSQPGRRAQPAAAPARGDRVDRRRAVRALADRPGGPRERSFVAGLATAGTVVVAQSSVDWLWLIPALFGLAVLALGLAAASEDDGEEAWPWRLAPRALVGIALFAAILSVGALFLSGVYIRKARQQALSSPSASLASARTAAQLDPVSVTPLYLQAAALESEGKRAAARRKLLDALDLEQGNFVTLGLLGDLVGRAGNEARARGYYRRALALNPLDTGLRKLSRGEES